MSYEIGVRECSKFCRYDPQDAHDFHFISFYSPITNDGQKCTFLLAISFSGVG